MDQSRKNWGDLSDEEEEEKEEKGKWVSGTSKITLLMALILFQANQFQRNSLVLRPFTLLIFGICCVMSVYGHSFIRDEFKSAAKTGGSFHAGYKEEKSIEEYDSGYQPNRQHHYNKPRDQTQVILEILDKITRDTVMLDFVFQNAKADKFGVESILQGFTSALEMERVTDDRMKVTLPMSDKEQIKAMVSQQHKVEGQLVKIFLTKVKDNRRRPGNNGGGWKERPQNNEFRNRNYEGTNRRDNQWDNDRQGDNKYHNNRRGGRGGRGGRKGDYHRGSEKDYMHQREAEMGLRETERNQTENAEPKQPPKFFNSNLPTEKNEFLQNITAPKEIKKEESQTREAKEAPAGDSKPTETPVSSERPRENEMERSQRKNDKEERSERVREELEDGSGSEEERRPHYDNRGEGYGQRPRGGRGRGGYHQNREYRDNRPKKEFVKKEEEDSYDNRLERGPKRQGQDNRRPGNQGKTFKMEFVEPQKVLFFEFCLDGTRAECK